MKYRNLLALCLIAAVSIVTGVYSQLPSVSPTAGPTATAVNSRRSVILHRSGVTAADKLSVPGTITATAVTESGSILTNASRNYAVAAGNKYGSTTTTTVAAITPTANQAVRLAFAAVSGADYYDVFLSTDTNPK